MKKIPRLFFLILKIINHLLKNLAAFINKNICNKVGNKGIKLSNSQISKSWKISSNLVILLMLKLINF